MVGCYVYHDWNVLRLNVGGLGSILFAKLEGFGCSFGVEAPGSVLCLTSVFNS